MSRYLAFAIVAFVATTSVAEEIPLDTIWALGMSGTRDIHELEGKPEDEQSMMAIIGRALKERHDVGPAFAVEGTGLEALRRVYYAITEQKPIPKSLPSGEVSVAFFTKFSRYYVHVTSVVVGPKNNIQIVYELMPHREEQRTLHFALIPLGKLSPGTYDVGIVAKPIDKKFIEDGFREAKAEETELTISSSFTLKID